MISGAEGKNLSLERMSSKMKEKNSERVISIVKKNCASREEQSHEEVRKLMRSNAKPGWRGS